AYRGALNRARPVSDNVISYIEMCRREGASLQAGMNFGLGGNHSVILMSLRRNAPYRDRIEDGGTTLIYEGHNHPKTASCPNPKVVDQPETLPSGGLTQNGKFHRAAQESKLETRPPERVRVYEKIRTGIWSYNGVFHLTDSWVEQDDPVRIAITISALLGRRSVTPYLSQTAELPRALTLDN